MARTHIDLVLFDVGGVLGTNGWDHDQRAAAVREFGLDEADFGYRHHEASAAWEEGRITLDEYLMLTVFDRPRPFSKETFSEFMFAQSKPFPDSIDLAIRLREHRRVRMMTLNNESRELNDYRIDRFGLASLFDAFLTSCYLAVRKPLPALYQRALGIAHADPTRTVFIDDREQNLAPARALGVRCILFTTATEVSQHLTELGL